MSFGDDVKAMNAWAAGSSPSALERMRQNRERFIQSIEEFAAGVPGGDATYAYVRQNGFTEEEACRIFEAGKALKTAATRMYAQFR